VARGSSRGPRGNVTIPASSVGCPFTINDAVVSANPGVNILMVVLHDGSFGSVKFDDMCNPGTSFDAGPFGCTGLD
jgi:hypothetical protein